MYFFDTGEFNYDFYKPRFPKSLLQSQTEILDEEANKIIDLLSSDTELSDEELLEYEHKLDLYYFQSSKPARMCVAHDVQLMITKDFMHHIGVSINAFEKKDNIHHTIIQKRHPFLYDQIKMLQMFFPTENIPAPYYGIPSELQDLHPYSDDIPPTPNSMQTDVETELSKYRENLKQLKELSEKAGKKSICEEMPVLLPIDDLTLPIELCFSFSSLNELRNLVKNERLKYMELEDELITLMKQQRSKKHGY